MIITYRSNKLKKQAENLKELSKTYGSYAKQIKKRFEELKAAENLAIIGKIPGANCHQLSGKNYKGYFAVSVSGNMRLIFEPNHIPAPRNESGGLNWSQITEITIEELCFD